MYMRYLGIRDITSACIRRRGRWSPKPTLGGGAAEANRYVLINTTFIFLLNVMKKPSIYRENGKLKVNIALNTNCSMFELEEQIACLIESVKEELSETEKLQVTFGGGTIDIRQGEIVAPAASEKAEFSASGENQGPKDHPGANPGPEGLDVQGRSRTEQSTLKHLSENRGPPLTSFWVKRLVTQIVMRQEVK